MPYLSVSLLVYKQLTTVDNVNNSNLRHSKSSNLTKQFPDNFFWIFFAWVAKCKIRLDKACGKPSDQVVRIPDLGNIAWKKSGKPSVLKRGNRNNIENQCWDSTYKCLISPLILFQRIRVSGEIEHFVSGEIRHFCVWFRHLILNIVVILNTKMSYFAII